MKLCRDRGDQGRPGRNSPTESTACGPLSAQVMTPGRDSHESPAMSCRAPMGPERRSFIYCRH